ncbi:MAG TPA: alpha/beta hydrolase [Solirubrobacterales bacterium]|jgi:pimeloyl-ACP methyl ester carboxylesterase|nr:alpha/beta hydrolase [Solirubrobacterales bacterium]
MDVKHYEYEGHKIAYRTYGSGKRAVVLVHSLLFNQEMHEPLARELSDHGNFVITIDMVGHGGSDTPVDRFDMQRYAGAVERLLDELEISEAVIGGTSLGANIGIEACVHFPERVRGVIADMPALERAIIGGSAIFTPIMLATRYLEPVARIGARAMRLVPRRPMPYSVNLILDILKRDPRATSEVLQGIYFGRLAPPRDERKTIEAPALVIGHKFDPVHPFKDATDLADDLPNAKFLEARSIVELRLMPKRLTAAIVDFVDECWKPRVVASATNGASGKRSGKAAVSRAAKSRRQRT